MICFGYEGEYLYTGKVLFRGGNQNPWVENSIVVSEKYP